MENQNWLGDSAVQQGYPGDTMVKDERSLFKAEIPMRVKAWRLSSSLLFFSLTVSKSAQCV